MSGSNAVDNVHFCDEVQIQRCLNISIVFGQFDICQIVLSFPV